MVLLQDLLQCDVVISILAGDWAYIDYGPLFDTFNFVSTSEQHHLLEVILYQMIFGELCFDVSVGATNSIANHSCFFYCLIETDHYKIRYPSQETVFKLVKETDVKLNYPSLKTFLMFPEINRVHSSYIITSGCEIGRHQNKYVWRFYDNSLCSALKMQCKHLKNLLYRKVIER